MKRKTVTAALFAFALVAPTFAMADEHDHDRDRDRHEEHHHYQKGERLRAEDHRNEYVVNDWRERRLHEPPHGYHWVRNGDDYVLAAIATGVIADIALNH
ncbi:MAG TPA: RcnB family protein [Usitatibacter sp.]|jgi:Ni/Co efflux regulator RcnB|nr:RcnB family protein [Usitatibacter sp.]